MSLEFAKQLAKDALGTQMKDVVDSFRAGSEGTAAAEAASDNLASIIIGQVTAMQNALKEDQELVVTSTIGQESFRVFEVFAPSPRLLVLTGVDAERNVTRVIAAVDSVQLVCKPMAVKADAKPVRLRCVVPQARTKS